MKTFRQITAIVIAFLMSVSIMPVIAYAAKNTVTVSNQKQLNKALANKSVKKIVIKTKKAQAFTIKSGKYTGKTLEINSANAKLTNGARFKSVLVKDVAKYNEKANNNSVTVSDDNIQITVTKGANVKSMSLTKDNATIALAVNGNIKNINVNATTDIEITGANADSIKEMIDGNADVDEAETTKLIAITIDDGPDGTGTEEYLKIIKEGNIKATFFVVGKNIASNSEQLTKMVDAGCEIGNHSFNHGYLNNMTVDEINEEIKNTNDAVRSVIPDYTIKTVRAPYFAYSEAMTSSIAAPLIDCSKSEKNNDYDKTLEELLNVVDGDIVLLHSWNESSRKALKKAIPTLKKKGFVFVTVSELFELQNQEPVNGTVYRNIAYNSANLYHEDKVVFEGNGYSDGDWSSWQAAVTLDKDIIKGMTAGTAIKVEYKSSSAPAMILQSYSGGQSWCQFECSFTDGTAAYFTYEDIVANFTDNSLCDAAFIYPWGAEVTVTKVTLLKK